MFRKVGADAIVLNMLETIFAQINVHEVAHGTNSAGRRKAAVNLAAVGELQPDRCGVGA